MSQSEARALSREADLWVGAMHAHLAQAHAHAAELERLQRRIRLHLRRAEAARRT
jgi:hypothetical protein